MRRHLRQIEHDARRIHRIRIGLRRLRRPIQQIFIGEARDALRRQPLLHSRKILERDRIHRKPAHQRPPLGGHVGDGKPRVHGKTGHTRPAEFHGRIQHFIVVVEPAQRNDDVFSGRARRQRAFQHHLYGSRNLPPEIAGRPRRRRVRADDRCSHRAQRAIHIGVRIGRDHKRSRHNISPLHHDLVSNTRTRRIEIHAVIFREAFNRLILVQIRVFFILDVVIQRKHQLPGIVNLLRADGLKLLHHRRSIVMRHHAMRPDGNKIPGPQRPLRPLGKMRLRDFLNNRLPHTTPISRLQLSHSLKVVILSVQ